MILRALTADDFAAVHSWASNPNNTRYMAWGPNTVELTKEFMDTATPGKDFAVVLKDTNIVIGSCGIYPDESHDKADIGQHKGTGLCAINNRQRTSIYDIKRFSISKCAANSINNQF